MRILALVASALLTTTSAAHGAERPHFFGGDLGWAEIHGSDDRGPSISARLGRALGASRSVAVDLGVNAAFADEGYVSGVLGLELRAFSRASISPFVRLEAGLLAEESAGYFVLGVGGGLAVRLSDGLALRAAMVFSDHGGGGGGPKVFQLGLEYRF